MNNDITSNQLNIDKSDWIPVRFGDVAFEPKDSVRDPLKEGIKHIVGLEHIQTGDIHLRSSSNINKTTTFRKKFSSGDVLFGRRRAYLRKAAKANFEGICSGDIIVLRAKDALIPELLPFIVHNHIFFDWAITHSSGSLSPRCKFIDLAKLKLLIPPRERQHEIAELLWAMDNLIISDRILLEKIAANDLAQLKFFFSNIDISNVMRMRDIISIQKGKKPSKLIHADDLNEDNREYGYKYLDAKYLRSKALSHKVPSNFGSKLVHIKDEDIIILWDGDVGDVFTGENGILCSTMAKISIKDKNITPKYLFNFLRFASTEIKRCAVGTTIKHVDPDVFSKLLIPKISLEEQSKIVKSFHTNHLASLALKNRLEMNNALNQTIINEVFTSEL